MYIDKWMHLAPVGNELVARSVAGYVSPVWTNHPNPANHILASHLNRGFIISFLVSKHLPLS